MQQLEHRGQRAYRDRTLAALAHHARASGAGGGGNRDDHFVGLGLVEDARQVALGVAAHPHTVDAQTVLARVVVEKAHRLQTKLAVAQDLAQHEAPTVTRADDQDVSLAAPAGAKASERAPLIQAARDDAHADQEQQREQEEQRDHAIWQLERSGARTRTRGLARCHPAMDQQMRDLHRPHDRHRHHGEQHDRDDRPRHRLVVALAGVAPATLVDTREHQHHETAAEHPPEGAIEQLLVAESLVSPGLPIAKAQLEGKPIGKRDERAVEPEPQ